MEDHMQTASLWVSPTARPAGADRAAHAALLASLGQSPPRPLPVWAQAGDIEARRDHLGGVLAALSDYVLAILDDTASNVPGGLDCRQIDALLGDLGSEVVGTLQQAADALPVARRRA
jgi:hypothetical protein